MFTPFGHVLPKRLIQLATSLCFLGACQLGLPDFVPETTRSINQLSAQFSSASDTNVVVVAHRGCWDDAPENSIAAILACIELGVPVVELDVRRTADGVLVLLHDETVDRTTNGSGTIAALTYEQASQFLLRSRDGRENPGTTSFRIPTFEEAMLTAKGKILVNVDAKEDVYEQAFEILNRTDTTDQVIMKRRVRPGDIALTTVAPFDRLIAMPVIFEDDDPDLIAVTQQLSGEPDAIELIFSTLEYGREAAELARANNVAAWVNTLGDWSSAGLYDEPALENPEAVWGSLIDMGYSIIQTDEPEALIAYLAERKTR
jgi:glycerophosphoryl diester phosphodiesterase